jgi:DNA polymerase, archaea type
MIFQILDANYTYDTQKRPLVQLFGETEEGKSVTCKVAGFKPYFYAGVKEGALDEVAEALKEMGLEVETVDRFEPIGYQLVPKKMLKITTKDPKEVRSLRDRVKGLPGVKAVY